MASSFLPLNSLRAWQKLDEHLSKSAFVTGEAPTEADLAIFEEFTEAPEAQWNNISHWHAEVSKLGRDMNKWPEAWRPQEGGGASAEKDYVNGYSAVVFDVKPFGEEVDMAEMEAAVRKINLRTLQWMGSELVPVFANIKLLRILANFQDDKFSVEEDLIAAITDLEDQVQSVDIFSWNRSNPY